MTIKTITQASPISLENRDMQMRTVRRNLFGTTVDRAELAQQRTELELEANKKLKHYTIESVIRLGANRNLKRFLEIPARCLETEGNIVSNPISTDNDEGDDDSQKIVTVDETPSASNQPTSSKKSEVRLIQLRTRGQKTITGEIAIVSIQLSD